MTKTEQTTKTQKVRKISKKEERARLEAARLRQRIEREQNLSRTTHQFARTMKQMADELDAAFLKTADPRAVQGGAICEEAGICRQLARQAAAFASRIDEF